MNSQRMLAELVEQQVERFLQQAEVIKVFDWSDCHKKILEVVTPSVRDSMEGKIHRDAWITSVQYCVDPDGLPASLSQKPAFVRTITAPSHDYLAALRRPYEPVV